MKYMGHTNKNIATRIYRIIAVVFAIGLASIFSTSTNVSAVGGTFEIQSATITDKSETVEGSIESFEGLNITSSLTFHKIGDTATYRITLKNIDDIGHTIKSITDNNTIENVSYSYDPHTGENIAAGATFDLAITVEYETTVSDMAQRTRTSDVKFTISFDDTEEDVSIVPNAPDTGGDVIADVASAVTSDAVLISALVISTTGIIAILIIRNKKKVGKYATITVTVFSVLTLSAVFVRAASLKDGDLTINSTINFKDKIAVTYIIDGSDNEVAYVNYGTTINKDIPGKAGYKAGGWSLEDGTDFDLETQITDDVTLIAKYNPISYTVSFNGNGARKGTMSDQTFVYDTAQNLSTNAYEKHGFGLVNWTTTENGEGGQSFTNGQEVNNLTTTDGETITLYAQWVSLPCNPNATDIEDTVCMQDINNQVVKTMPIDEQYQLRDSRDNIVYDVMKLADGNIWMQENLRIMDKTISSVDSHLPEGMTFTIPASDIAAFDDDIYHAAAYLHDEYGGYYNFYAATAGWDNYTSNEASQSPMDICPKGWRLPSTEDADYLMDAYGGWDYNDDVVNRLMIVASGSISDGELDYVGWDSDIWTGRHVGDRSAAEIYSYEYDGKMWYSPGSSAGRYHGYNVRCISDKPTMQEFDKDNNNYTIQNIGDSAHLEDTRFGYSFDVKKLADGNVWMTDNLVLFNGIDIDYTDTNLPDGEAYKAPTLTSRTANFTAGYSDSNAYFDHAHEDYGVYYNFYAATASWGKDATTGNAPKDLCPRGWRLPTDAELTTLVNSYDSPAQMAEDADFLLAGHIVQGQLVGIGELEDIWSSTVRDADTAFSFLYDGSLTSFVNTAKVGDGKTIRCLAK